MTSLPPPDPFTSRSPASEENPYAGIELDLSSAVFREAQAIDDERLEQVLSQLQRITASNLENRQKWTSLLQAVDAGLRVAGLVVRLTPKPA